MIEPRDMVSVRYMVDDVEAAVTFYTEVLDFEIHTTTPPAFANVTRGNLRLLLSGPTSSAGRPMADGAKPGPGGWNRIHLVVDDIDADVARLREAGARFRNNAIEGPGGKQILALDPSGNVVELFQMARETNPSAPRGPARALRLRMEEQMITPGIDHIALLVPDLDAQVDRLANEFGMVVEVRLDGFALVADPASGLKLELGRSDDPEVHFRHVGFRADDVDAAHQHLIEVGMQTSEVPHRRDFAGMYTSFLAQPGGLDVQLVKYD